MSWNPLPPYSRTEISLISHVVWEWGWTKSQFPDLWPFTSLAIVVLNTNFKCTWYTPQSGIWGVQYRGIKMQIAIMFVSDFVCWCCVYISTAHMIAEVQMWVEKVAWISDINPAVTSELWFYDDIYLHRTPFTDWHLTSGVLQISFWLGSAPFSCFFASSAHSTSRGTSRLVSLLSASDPALEEL